MLQNIPAIILKSLAYIYYQGFRQDYLSGGGGPNGVGGACLGVLPQDIFFRVVHFSA